MFRFEQEVRQHCATRARGQFVRPRSIFLTWDLLAPMSNMPRYMPIFLPKLRVRSDRNRHAASGDEGRRWQLQRKGCIPIPSQIVAASRRRRRGSAAVPLRGRQSSPAGLAGRSGLRSRTGRPSQIVNADNDQCGMIYRPLEARSAFGIEHNSTFEKGRQCRTKVMSGITSAKILRERSGGTAKHEDTWRSGAGEDIRSVGTGIMLHGMIFGERRRRMHMGSRT